MILHSLSGANLITSLPPGWIQQWDQNSQRYFYVEQATGRTQWEPPAFSPPPGGPFSPPPAPYGAPGYGAPAHGAPYGAPGYGHEANRGHDGGYGAAPYGAPGGDYKGDKGDKEKKKDKDKSNTGKLVAAGAVGAIGGAVIASQLGPSLCYAVEALLTCSR